MRDVLRRFEYILLIGGFLCLSYVGFSYGRAYIYQSYESYKLDQARLNRPADFTGYLGSLFGKKQDQRAEQTPSEAHVEPGPDTDVGLVGRIEIPRLELSAMVREGVDDATLGEAVGHVPSTALPGMRGNVGIAAHRDTYFRPVRYIRKGDIIRMVTGKATYEYAVESMKIVSPKQVDVLDPTPQPALTLITCYPFNFVGHAPKRYIVRARQVRMEAKLSRAASGS